MGGKSSPPPPDYRGAAQEQAQASVEQTNMQNYANRPTQITPFGTQSWQTNAVIDPATGQRVTQWTQNTQLAPQSQAALDSQLALQQGRSDLAQGFMGRVADSYQQPFDWQNLPERVMPNAPGQLQSNIADYSQNLQTGVSPLSSNIQTGFATNPINTNAGNFNEFLSRGVAPTRLQMGLSNRGLQDIPTYDMSARNQIADQLMERMQPTQDRQIQGLQAQLSNQGFQVGSEAYNRAMGDLLNAQSRERFNALDMAGNEAQRMYQTGLGARQQGFNERQTMGSFANSAAGQAFNQSLGAEQFRNQTAGQGFGQNLGALQFGNQAQQQDYAQRMGLSGLNNQALGQAFNQNLQAAQFGNQALGQASGLDINRMQAMNQAAGQAFNFGNQYADQMARLRQQAIAEQQLQRAMPLNEMNALLTGQQVGMPQMPSFQASQRAETPQLLQAANLGYQANLDASNAQNAAFGNLLGAGAQLGSAYMFSDARIKSNIRRVGTHPIGVGVYEYTIAGMPQTGVLAQEVQAVRPDLIKRHANGYLMVNYGGL